jgi:hypothetical protein
MSSADDRLSMSELIELSALALTIVDAIGARGEMRRLTLRSKRSERGFHAFGRGAGIPTDEGENAARALAGTSFCSRVADRRGVSAGAYPCGCEPLGCRPFGAGAPG